MEYCFLLEKVDPPKKKLLKTTELVVVVLYVVKLPSREH
jgi:hypothetical protein